MKLITLVTCLFLAALTGCDNDHGIAGPEADAGAQGDAMSSDGGLSGDALAADTVPATPLPSECAKDDDCKVADLACADVACILGDSGKNVCLRVGRDYKCGEKQVCVIGATKEDSGCKAILCGNGTCDADKGETTATCAADCPAPPPAPMFPADKATWSDGWDCTIDSCGSDGTVKHLADDRLCGAMEKCDPVKFAARNPGKTSGSGCVGPLTAAMCAMICNDSIACTTDACGSDEQCKRIADDSKCASGQICDLTMGCIAKPAPPAPMCMGTGDDGLGCTTDVCESGAWVHKDICPTGTKCQASGCVSTSPPPPPSTATAPKIECVSVSDGYELKISGKLTDIVVDGCTKASDPGYVQYGSAKDEASITGTWSVPYASGKPMADYVSDTAVRTIKVSRAMNNFSLYLANKAKTDGCWIQTAKIAALGCTVAGTQFLMP